MGFNYLKKGKIDFSTRKGEKQFNPKKWNTRTFIITLWQFKLNNLISSVSQINP
jgi:hypothetical protein